MPLENFGVGVKRGIVVWEKTDKVLCTQCVHGSPARNACSSVRY